MSDIALRPEIVQTPAAISALRAIGLEKSRHDVQISRATIIVDLRPDEDALIASFKPKRRRAIWNRSWLNWHAPIHRGVGAAGLSVFSPMRWLFWV